MPSGKNEGMLPFITDAVAVSTGSERCSCPCDPEKEKYGGIYSECYLLYYVFEETKENSLKIIIAKYAYHWYNKL